MTRRPAPRQYRSDSSRISFVGALLFAGALIIPIALWTNYPDDVAMQASTLIVGAMLLVGAVLCWALIAVTGYLSDIYVELRKRGADAP